MTIFGVVLAAGASRRLGREKQLVPYHGRPLVRIAAEAAREANLARVAVVVGRHAHPVSVALRGLDVDIVPNLDTEEGIASSIRRGLAWARAEAQPASGVMFLVCDQPYLTGEHLRVLGYAFTRHGGAKLVASRYSGVLGVPAIFGRDSFDALAALHGDEGAKGVLRARPDDVIAIDFPDGAFDVDTRGDVARLADAPPR